MFEGWKSKLYHKINKYNDIILNRFIPQIQDDRALCGDDILPAIFSMDNYSSHLDNELLRITEENLI